MTFSPSAETNEIAGVACHLSKESGRSSSLVDTLQLTTSPLWNVTANACAGVCQCHQSPQLTCNSMRLHPANSARLPYVPCMRVSRASTPQIKKGLAQTSVWRARARSKARNVCSRVREAVLRAADPGLCGCFGCSEATWASYRN